MLTQKDIAWILEKPRQRTREKTIKKTFPEEYNYIINTQGSTFSQKLYNYIHNITSEPKCPVCGKPVGFYNIVRGYRTYCSTYCQNHSDLHMQRARETCKRKYGVSNVSILKETRDKVKKTCMEKYGVDNVFANEKIKQKIRETNQKNLGVSYPSQNKDVQDKIRKTCREKYGVDNIFKTEKSKQNMLAVRHQKTLSEHPELIAILDNGQWKMSCPYSWCDKCTEKYFITSQNINNCRQYGGFETCTRLVPISSRTSSLEIKVQNLFKENGIEYINNDRKILNGKELDIYIPSKKLAIEINGCYWHSDKYKSKNYHMEKYLECESNGIQLLTLWEDQLVNSWEKVKNMILSKLGIYKERIYARKTVIQEVPASISREFQEKYHMQGYANALITMGLYTTEGLLVSIMSFGRRKINRDKNKRDTEWELIRYCNRGGYEIIGGASKLLSGFIKKYNPDSITSFSSNDISNGNLYKILGFEKKGKVVPGYWYINPETLIRYHRFVFTKSKLIAQGYDSKLSEKEIMKMRGWIRIYDSGQTKWVYSTNIK